MALAHVVAHILAGDIVWALGDFGRQHGTRVVAGAKQELGLCVVRDSIIAALKRP